MESRNTSALRVRVTPRDEEGFGSQDRKERFWNAVRQAPPSAVEVSSSELEARLVRNFGRELKQKLVDYLHESWSGRGHRHDFPGSLQSGPPALGNQLVALGCVFFEARIDRYASLDFSVEIAGARQLATLFDNDVSLLLMFMRAYVPVAFESAIGIHSLPDGALDFGVSGSDELREAFAAPPQKKGALRLPEASREMVLWAIANGTLIPAVVLALVVCYVAFKGIVEERASLIAAQQRVAEQQAAVLKESTQRLEQAHRIEDQLIKRGLESMSQNQPQPQTPAGATSVKKSPP